MSIEPSFLLGDVIIMHQVIPWKKILESIFVIPFINALLTYLYLKVCKWKVSYWFEDTFRIMLVYFEYLLLNPSRYFIYIILCINN